jgi:hypothetical protein
LQQIVLVSMDDYESRSDKQQDDRARVKQNYSASTLSTAELPTIRQVVLDRWIKGVLAIGV